MCWHALLAPDGYMAVAARADIHTLDWSPFVFVYLSALQCSCSDTLFPPVVLSQHPGS